MRDALSLSPLRLEDASEVSNPGSPWVRPSQPWNASAVTSPSRWHGEKSRSTPSARAGLKTVCPLSVKHERPDGGRWLPGPSLNWSPPLSQRKHVAHLIFSSLRTIRKPHLKPTLFRPSRKTQNYLLRVARFALTRLQIVPYRVV